MRKIVVLAALLAGCGSSTPELSSTVIPAPPTVRLAALYNLTGSQSSLDLPSALGAQLAVAQARAGGQSVDLLLQDGQSDPNVLHAAAQALLSSHPTAFMGLSDTNMVLAADPPGQLFLTSGATSPLLPQQAPGVALACFGDNTQAAAAAEFAFGQLGARRVSIIFDDTADYTVGLQRYFAERFTQLGGTVVSSAALTDPGLTFDGDLVFFAALPQEVLAGVHGLRAAGFGGPILGGDAYDGPVFTNESGVFFTTHADLSSSDPRVTSFVSAYRSAWNSEPTPFSALGYDTVNLLLTTGGNVTGLQSFDGVTGHFSYNGSAVPLKTVTVVEIEGGQRSVPAHFVPAVVPAP